MSDDTNDDNSISLPIANPEESGDGDDAPPKSRDEGGDILSEIEKEVQENEIVLYMKGHPQQPMCGFSARASAVIASYDRPFHSVNILEDQEKRQGVKDYSDWPTIPQIYIGGEFVGGSDILMEMHENGEIAPLIDDAFDN